MKLTAADGMPVECVLKPEWIQTVERPLIGALISRFPDDRWSEVRDALLSALGLASV